MSAVFRREFKAFFTSPIGYFVLAVLFAFSGFFFTAYNLIGGSSSLTGVQHRAHAGAAYFDHAPVQR